MNATQAFEFPRDIADAVKASLPKCGCGGSLEPARCVLLFSSGDKWTAMAVRETSVAICSNGEHVVADAHLFDGKDEKGNLREWRYNNVFVKRVYR